MRFLGPSNHNFKEEKDYNSIVGSPITAVKCNPNYLKLGWPLLFQITWCNTQALYLEYFLCSNFR